jgi:hypothetical protein
VTFKEERRLMDLFTNPFVSGMFIM